MISAIVTIPPYAPFINEVVNHPSVSGLRLNTVMPVKETLEDVLKRLKDEAFARGKDIWIDLKCRQLRVVGYAVTPFTELKISHRIELNVPADAYFSDGKEKATVVGVDGDRLLMLEGPRRILGPGEAINIPDASLKIEGYLTDTDKRYIDAGMKTGLHDYMLSFVEQQKDIETLLQLDNEASIVAKIESRKGLSYMKNEWTTCTYKPRLMAARGDLYAEVKMPHQIIEAVETIVKIDSHAIVASRLFGSFSESLEPSCADIGDADNLLRMGYKTFMLGDDICMRRDSLMSALNLFQALAQRYEVNTTKS
ncbi:MAG: pyruvate kinase [Candidatus Woesearchaeota archaeon]|nr:pyruvate kinase [Candidatus Woesearchaeota archaeon]